TDAVTGDDGDPKRHRLQHNRPRFREGFAGIRPLRLNSADRRKGPERGAGQDAPPAPGSPAFGTYLLGGLGIRRPGVRAAAGRRHRWARLRLTLRRLDQAVEDLPGPLAVERFSGHGHGL